MQVAGTVLSKTVRKRGLVKWYDRQKGYGFLIIPDEPDFGDVFVYFAEVNKAHYPVLLPGLVVEFDVGCREDGRKYGFNLSITSVRESYRDAPVEEGLLTYVQSRSRYAFIQPNTSDGGDLYVPAVVCAMAHVTPVDLHRQVRFLRARFRFKKPLVVWLEFVIP